MRKQWILFLIAIFLGVNAMSQSCAEIASNALCGGDDENPSNNLSAGSFNFGCFQSSSSFSYLMTTGGQGGNVSIEIQRSDCDYIQIDPILGTAQVALDSIFLTVIQINPDLGACDTSLFIDQIGCYLILGETQSFILSNLPTHSDFLIVVGSNHNQTLFGPCSIAVSVSGPPFEIGAAYSPSFIFAGQEAQITVSGQSPDATISWTPSEFVGNPSAATTNAFPTESTEFLVNSQIGECETSSKVNINVGEAIGFSNAISPNGDNVNDFWEIYGIQKFPRAEVNVYDRWGQNVFRSIGYASPWDGTNRGKKLPTGSYYYVIELNSPVVYIEPYTGFISVMH